MWGETVGVGVGWEGGWEGTAGGRVGKAAESTSEGTELGEQARVPLLYPGTPTHQSRSGKSNCGDHQPHSAQAFPRGPHLLPRPGWFGINDRKLEGPQSRAQSPAPYTVLPLRVWGLCLIQNTCLTLEGQIAER